MAHTSTLQVKKRLSGPDKKAFKNSSKALELNSDFRGFVRVFLTAGACLEAVVGLVARLVRVLVASALAVHTAARL